jgi:hypothetical protein
MDEKESRTFKRNAKELNSMHQVAVNRKMTDAERFRRNIRFRELDQWGKEEKDALVNNGRNALTRDRVRRNFMALDGQRVANKVDYKLYSRIAETNLVAITETANTLIASINSESGAETIERDMFYDTLSCGRGWAKVYFDPTENNGEGEIGMEYVDYLNIYPDPAFKGREVNNSKNKCRYISIETTMPIFEISERYDIPIENLHVQDGAKSENIDGDYNSSAEEYDGFSKNLFIIETYERRFVPVSTIETYRKIPDLVPISDALTGSYAGEEAEFLDPSGEKSMQIELINTRKEVSDYKVMRPEKVEDEDGNFVEEIFEEKKDLGQKEWVTFMYIYIKDSDQMLDQGSMMFLSGRLPFFNMNWDIKKNGLDIAYIDEWIDAQIFANKVFSVMADKYAKSGHAVMLDPNGSIDNNKLIEALLGNSSKLDYDTNKAKGDKPYVEKMPSVGNDDLMLLNIAGDEIDKRKHIQDVQEGQVSSGTRSAAQYQMQLSEAQKTSNPIIKSMQSMYKEKLRLLIDFIGEYYDNTTMIVGGNSSIPIEEFVRMIKNDEIFITIDEGQNSPARRGEVRQQIQYAAALGIAVPKQVIAKTLDTPYNEEIVAAAKMQDSLEMTKIQFQLTQLQVQLASFGVENINNEEKK